MKLLRRHQSDREIPETLASTDREPLAILSDIKSEMFDKTIKAINRLRISQ